jgi:hypothetical protein
MAATESQSTNGNSKVGKINYDGKIYTITTGIYSHLMIEKTMLKGENRSTSVAKGKKLGFVLQEIGREINTIGSKANHAPIQKLVVLMKDDLEKIKEQGMNFL